MPVAQKVGVAAHQQALTQATQMGLAATVAFASPLHGRCAERLGARVLTMITSDHK